MNTMRLLPSCSIVYPGSAPVNDSLRIAGGSHMRRKFAAPAEELRCCDKPPRAPPGRQFYSCFIPMRGKQDRAPKLRLSAELKEAPQSKGSQTFIPASAAQRLRRSLRAVRRSPRSPARRRCTSSPARNARQSARARRAPWSRSPRPTRRWDGQARWRRHSGWSSPC